jgi:transcriptional regulator with XRE-family HTH domain
LINDRIRALREQLGMSQSELADRVPLSQKQVSRIERGCFVQLPRRTLVRLAEVLDRPLVTGEVNEWLLQSGYAPLIRPDLPLPPDLSGWLQGVDGLPVAVIDPAGTVRHANALFQALAGPGRRGQENVLFWAVDARSPLDPRDRPRLLMWHLGWLRYAAGEPWVARLRESVLARHPDAKSLWDRCAEPALTPLDLSAAPVRLTHAQYSPLTFRISVSQPFWRPDLQILVFRPDDRRTEAWRREARASGLKVIPTIRHRSS